MTLVTTSGVLQGSGGPPAPPPEAQINSVTGSYAEPSGATITYSSAPLGSPVTGRVLYIVCPFFDGSTTDSAPDTVTVGGNAATLVVSAHLTGATACGVSIWKYQDDGALGTSADVVAEHLTGRTSRSIVVVNATIGDGVIEDTTGESGSTPLSGTTLDTADATCLLYASITQNGTESSAPSPFTDGDYSYDENSTEWVHIGWDNSPSGSVESVNMPTGSGARGAYVAVALS